MQLPPSGKARGRAGALRLLYFWLQSFITDRRGIVRRSGLTVQSGRGGGIQRRAHPVTDLTRGAFRGGGEERQTGHRVRAG